MRATRALRPRAPVQKQAIPKPEIACPVFLPELAPVITVGVFIDFERVAFRRVERRLVELVNAIRPARPRRVDELIGQPADLVFVIRVEMLIARACRAHRVEDVPVFDMRAVADDRLAARVPGVRVPERKIMPELVRRHAHARRLQPAALSADIRLPREPARPAAIDHAIEIVLPRIVARRLRRRPRLGEHGEIVIRRDATDQQLIKLSNRFDVPLDEMRAFRETRALPWDATMTNAAHYVHIPNLGEESAQPTEGGVKHG